MWYNLLTEPLDHFEVREFPDWLYEALEEREQLSDFHDLLILVLRYTPSYRGYLGRFDFNTELTQEEKNAEYERVFGDLRESYRNSTCKRTWIEEIQVQAHEWEVKNGVDRHDIQDYMDV